MQFGRRHAVKTTELHGTTPAGGWLTSLQTTRRTRSSQPCWMRSRGISSIAGLLDEHDHLERGEQGGGEEGDVAADAELG